MNRLLLLPQRIFDRAIVYAASGMVPCAAREDWRREWLAELWQVERRPVQNRQNDLSELFVSTCFCLGAFRDARDLRRAASASWGLWSRVDRSAWACLMGLGALLLVSFTASLLLPGAAEARHASRFQVHPGLVLIRDAGAPSDWSATVPAALYRQWKNSRQRGFDDFAYYRIERASLGGLPERSIVHASVNLFSLLGLHVTVGDATKSHETTEPLRRVVLSDAAWRRQFGADPRIVNRDIWIDARPARVVAVAPAGVWRLPGGAPDAWLLESDASLEAGGDGYVVAHLSRSGANEMWGGRVPITYNNADGDSRDFWGVDFAERTSSPARVYLFAMMLVLLALPAVTSVWLEDLPFSVQRASWERVLLRYGFLLFKSVLVMGITYYLSLDLTYGHTTGYVPGAAGVQFLASLLIGLLGMRWAILDQQHRCPICLRKVTHPARVGMASRTFLAWNGTEMICTGGHTLLHVPSLPTSWFNAPRWVYLDASWHFLFSE